MFSVTLILTDLSYYLHPPTDIPSDEAGTLEGPFIKKHISPF